MTDNIKNNIYHEETFMYSNHAVSYVLTNGTEFPYIQGTGKA